MATPTKTSSAKKTILWVEDDPFIRQRIGPKLEDAGFSVLTSDNAGGAMSLFRKHRECISLVILDVMLPAGAAFDEKTTMGGFETGLALARWIHDKEPTLPLVAFSLSTERDVTSWFIEHGAAYVEKSYDGAKLVECIRTLLATNDTTAQAETEVLFPDISKQTDRLAAVQRLGRYEIRNLIGQGAMGSVYLGWDKELQREVAIKSPRRERLGPDLPIDTLLEEARTAAKLKHPHIVSVYDIWRTSDGTPLIVMEYVEGSSLRRLLDTERPSLARTRELIVPIVEAIDFAHAAGFVHRDIKPGNILIDSTGTPKLTDFGLAIHVHNTRNLAGLASGTLPYMSPEQVRGETDRLDGRSDIWAIGVVLYEMIAGHRPFDGNSPRDVMDQILNSVPTLLRASDASAPTDLRLICWKCLRKDVWERYTNAAELLTALRNKQSIVDWSQLLAELGNDTMLVQHLSKTFVNDYLGLLESVERAILHGDLNDLYRRSHIIKGCMKMLCARAAFDCARALEMCGRKRDPSALDEAQYAFSLLKSELARVVEELKKGPPES